MWGGSHGDGLESAPSSIERSTTGPAYIENYSRSRAALPAWALVGSRLKLTPLLVNERQRPTDLLVFTVDRDR